MYKIFYGILKKIPTEQQFELSLKKELDLRTVSFVNTIRTTEISENGDVIEYIPFRVSFRETDKFGNEKFILNEKTNEYEKAFKMSPVVNAYGKEMRIICEMEEYTPVKIVVREKIKGERTFYKLVCIQNQTLGKA
ncbi:MAG: hypothetical protein ACRCUP_02980 [Mycoplasmatales bacterium]